MRILRVRYEDGVLKPLGEHCLEEAQEFNIAIPEPGDLDWRVRSKELDQEPVEDNVAKARDQIEYVYEMRRMGTRVEQDS